MRLFAVWYDAGMSYYTKARGSNEYEECLQAEVTQRLMSALALRGEGASRPREALTLLNHALGSDSLLVQGRLQEYCACLSAVLSGCASLQAELASSLLMCFDMRGLCVAMMQTRPAATDQVINMYLFAASLGHVALCTPTLSLSYP